MDEAQTRKGALAWKWAIAIPMRLVSGGGDSGHDDRADVHGWITREGADASGMVLGLLTQQEAKDALGLRSPTTG